MQRLTATIAVAAVLVGTAQGQPAHETPPFPGPGCTPGIPFEHSPEPLGRFAGTAWAPRAAAAAVLSEDDGARHSRGYRNRWRYTLTGSQGVGLPAGCEARLVTVRALPGGFVAVDIDEERLLLLPGDPTIQDRIAALAPVCERNRQLVNVAETAGRWVVTIEEPSWLPWSRERC